MGTGNSKRSAPNLTRKDSKRSSWRKKKSNNQGNKELEQENITAEEITTKRQRCLADLKKSVTKLGEMLNSYNDKLPEITSLLDILQEHKTKNTSDNGDVTDSQEFRVTIQRIENVLKYFKMFPQCAKDSVKDAKDSLETLEENIKVEDDMNTNSVSKPLAIKRRGSKHKTSVPATIQIICKQDGKLMNDIQSALETTLRSTLGTVTFISLNDISKIDDKKMLIILCIVATRIASDAASAMQDIKNPANAALVIIDIDEAHELSNTHNLTGDAFKNLRGIYGLSFMKSNGSFPNCDMNDKSINGLSSFCKQQPYSEKL